MNKEDFELRYVQLTQRQQEILDLFYIGRSDEEISKFLFISQDTVRRHISNICRIFFSGNQRNSRTQLMQLCERFLNNSKNILTITPQNQNNRILGNIPIVNSFLGRHQEVHSLKEIILNQQSRLILLTGMGGVGKTTLAAYFARIIQDELECVIWKNIQVPIRLDELLNSWLVFLNNALAIQKDIPDNNGDKILQLIECLKHRSCLIILDNYESLMQEGRAGFYSQEHQEYAQLLQSITNYQHRSFLLITSREIPNEIAHDHAAVSKFQLSGFDVSEGRSFLRQIGDFCASDSELHELINYYRGNPLNLRIVATIIQELYSGNISQFIEQSLKTGLYNENRQLFYSHFNRLSNFEKAVIYSLTINREPMSRQDLQQTILGTEALQNLDDSILSLRRRSLIEESKQGYTIQPVLMKYSTEAFLNQLMVELQQEELKLFESHALVKTVAKDYIRDIQIKLFVQPVIERLTQHLGNRLEVEKFLQNLLNKLRNYQLNGYAGGNLFNLLCHSVSDFKNYDFSHLMIRGANLRGIKLRNTNFQNSHFVECLFSNPLAGILWVTFNTNGELLAAGDISGNIHIWSINQVQDNYELVPNHTFEGHDGWVWTVRFSPDERYLASAGDGYQVRIWDLRTKQLVKLLHGHNDVIRSISFNRNGILASASNDGTVKLWNLDSEECIDTFIEPNTRVHSVSFNPGNSQILATASDDKKVRVWNIQTGKIIRIFDGHTDVIRTVCFSPNGKYIASAGNDNTVRLWNVETGESQILLGHTHWVRSVDFSPDSELLLSASEDQTVRLWDIDTGLCLKIFREHTSWVQSVRFSPDGKRFASGSADRTVKLWDANQGCLTTVQGYTNYLLAIGFHPDGNILASGYEDKTIRLWNLTTLEYQTLRGHQDWVRSVTFSSDGQILASCSGDKTVRIWNLITGECRILKGHTSFIRQVRFSTNDRYLASCSDDKTIKIWDITSGLCIRTLDEHKGWVRAVVFSPDGKLLMSASGDTTIKVWDIQDINNIQCIQTLVDHHNWIWYLSFSPDSQILASAGGDATVRIWRYQNNQWVNCQVLTAHTKSVRVVAFNFDGNLLASAGVDRSLCLWNTQTWQLINQPIQQSDWIRSLAFNQQGLLAIASQDSVIYIRDINGREVSTLRLPKLYEGMNISGATGLTSQQIQNLRALGATWK